MLILGSTIAGSMVSAGGSLLGGAAANEGAQYRAAALEQGGLIAQQEAEFQAQQLDQSALESRAASRIDAYEKRRAAKLALSTLTARAAAGGGSATDATVLDLGEGIAERGEFGALLDMFTGENRARGLEDQAKGARYSGAARRYAAELEAQGVRYGGKAAQVGSYFSAGGQILSGVGSAFRGSKAYG